MDYVSDDSSILPLSADFQLTYSLLIILSYVWNSSNLEAFMFLINMSSICSLVLIFPFITTLPYFGFSFCWRVDLITSGCGLVSSSMSPSWLGLLLMMFFDIFLITQGLCMSLVGFISSSSPLCFCVIYGLCSTLHSCSPTFGLTFFTISFESGNFSFYGVHQKEASLNTTFLDV